MQALCLRRRSLFGAAASLALPALAQQPRTRGAPVTVAQVVDMSAREQDVAKDFLVGSRAAWADVNARGGIQGRPVQHLVLETDGTPASVRQAWEAAREAVVLSGTVSDPVAGQLAALLRQENAAIAHAAPWLQGGNAAADARTFPVFASRQAQITHALKSMTTSGMQELGVVFASAREAALYRDELARSAAAMGLRIAAWTAQGSPAQLAQALGPGTPAILLFVGGTPELVQFTQGLQRQNRGRYLVALADVNLQAVQQMGAARSTPIIATQVVPMVSSALPIVRRYRDVLARLYDEPPVALGLAGFIAARYTAEVLAQVEGGPSRAAVLATFQRRTALDLGGFRVPAEGSGGFVTQSMLTPDGRLVG